MLCRNPQWVDVTRHLSLCSDNMFTEILTGAKTFICMNVEGIHPTAGSTFGVPNTSLEANHFFGSESDHQSDEKSGSKGRQALACLDSSPAYVNC